MSYSLFSYLKENPRLNGPKVNYNWSKILTDTDVPVSVKAELNELIDYKFIQLSDAVLFWSDHVQMLRMTDTGEYKVIRGKQTWCTHKYEIFPEFGSQFALTVYSLTQLDPDNATRYATLTYKDIFNVSSTRELFTRLTNWTIDKVKCLFSNDRYRSCVLGTVYYSNSSLSDADCYDLYDWLDEEFMSRLGMNQIREIKQLIKDCDKPTIKFKSMNEIERAHDARTEREATKLARDELTLLSYHPDLVEVATKYGFTLPPDNISFIKRGKQHSNCVATYYSKHTAHVALRLLDSGETREVSRLFFTANATLELSIEYCAQGIVSTKVIQYKGRFNKDAVRDKALIALRVTLVGMPTEILEITGSKKHEKESTN